MSQPKPSKPKVRNNMPIILIGLLAIIAVASVAFLILVARLSVEEADLWLRPITGILLLFTFVVGGAMLITGYIVVDKLSVRVANAQTEAALAKTRADQEAIKRLELEKYLQPRELPDRQWARIIGQPDPVEPLIPFSGMTAIISALNELEAYRAAGSIEGTLKAAAWTVKGEPPPSDIPNPRWDGVKIDKATGRAREGDKAPQASDALIGVLRSYNWQVEYRNVSPDKLPINTVRITIGFNSVTRYFWPRTYNDLVEESERRVTIENAKEKSSPK
jgi:hypothetical protein